MLFLASTQVGSPMISSRLRWRDILGREDLYVIAGISVAIFLLSLMVIFGAIFSPGFEFAERSVREFCLHQHFDTLASNKECQNFWYKTLHDPSAAFSLGSLVVNIFLVISGIAAVSITLHGINKQLKNAERLFRLDQRPRLAPEISLNQPIFQINPIHWTSVNLIYEIPNIGKNIAIEVSEPFVKYYPFYPGEPNVDFLKKLAKGDIERQRNYNTELIKVRDNLRDVVRNVKILPSGVIHAGRSIRRNMSFEIPRSVSNRMAAKPGELVFHFCFIVIFYKSKFSDDIYESTLVFRFLYGAMGFGPIPRTEDELRVYTGIADLTSTVPGLFREASLELVDSLSIYK